MLSAACAGLVSTEHTDRPLAVELLFDAACEAGAHCTGCSGCGSRSARGSHSWAYGCATAKTKGEEDINKLSVEGTNSTEPLLRTMAVLQRALSAANNRHRTET